MRRLLAAPCAATIVLFARLVTAVRGLWRGVEPVADRQRVYFANHCSHADFVLLWTVLPPRLRRQTRPVAGADYWLRSSVKRFIGEQVFRAVLIQRGGEGGPETALQHMCDALDQGDSLILFPEGTRNTTESRLLPFRSGLYHLARKRRDVELVPVWIAHLNRVLPKGEFVPVPLLCTVTFGEAIRCNEQESKVEFLERAQAALLALADEESA